jgi:hypothetical protein
LLEAEGAWVIEDDPHNRRFLDKQSAATTVLGNPLSGELLYYRLKREDESGIVLTYPEVIERILAEGGWTLVGSARTIGDLQA